MKVFAQCAQAIGGLLCAVGISKISAFGLLQISSELKDGAASDDYFYTQATI